MSSREAAWIGPLLLWFEKNQRALPWRKDYDAYHVWVSEVMLQQTRVDQMLVFYKRFLDQFPTVDSLASAAEQDVLKAWEGLGYYSRARHLHQAAKTVAEKYNGQLPQDYFLLRSLPGFGPYISAAVASIAFNLPKAVVDGNVIRVMARLEARKENFSKPQNIRALEDHLNDLIPQDHARAFNQSLMELGALVCLPDNPLCEKCPVRAHCKAFALNQQQNFPVKDKKKSIPTRHFAALVVRGSSGVLLRQRADKGLLANMWEFPMIAYAPLQDSLDSVRARFESERGLRVQHLKGLGIVEHTYTHFHQIVHAFSAELEGMKDSSMNQWTSVEALKHTPISKVNQKLLELVCPAERFK